MISKKSRKVVAALLIGATVCASGTFAYFNSKVDMDKIAGLDTAQKELKITNGKINITGKLANVVGANTESWTYDVARVSTIDDATALIAAGALPNGFKGKNSQGYDLTTLGSTFTDVNRSPDLAGTKQETVDTTHRVALGTGINGEITNARPGDAFVLGKDTYDEQGNLSSSNGGIQIINNSNLTTKIGFRLKLNKDTNTGNINADQKKQLDALATAGWKVYLRVETPAGVNPNNKYGDWKEFDIKDFYDSTAEAGKQVTTYQVASLDPGTNSETGIKFQVRVELPLLTGNNMMEKSNTSATLVNGLDLTKLFEVVATQENNPGWTQDGTTPADGDAFTDPTADADRN